MPTGCLAATIVSNARMPTGSEALGLTGREPDPVAWWSGLGCRAGGRLLLDTERCPPRHAAGGFHPQIRSIGIQCNATFASDTESRFV